MNDLDLIFKENANTLLEANYLQSDSCITNADNSLLNLDNCNIYQVDFSVLNIEDTETEHKDFSLDASTLNVLEASTTRAGETFVDLVEDDSTGTLSNVASATYASVTAGCAKTITGQGSENTTLSGTFYGNHYNITMNSLTYDGYFFGGAEQTVSDNNWKATFLTIINNTVKFTDGQRAYGGDRITTSNVSITSNNYTFQILADDSFTMGPVYGGGYLVGADTVNKSYTINSLELDIKGGHYANFVGCGSQIDSGATNTVNWGSTFFADKGTFDSYVYGGVYSQGGTATVRSCKLTLNGLRNSEPIYVNSYVFGGCAASRNSYARNTTVSTNTQVFIKVWELSPCIIFNSNSRVYAGSQANGSILGNTTMSFQGNGLGLEMNGAKIYGGSSSDGWNKNSFAGNPVDSVAGTKYLSFKEFQGTFTGTITDTFDNVDVSSVSSYGKGTVIWGQADLASATEWTFDITDEIVDLVWTEGTNNFANDKINLGGAPTNEWKTIMVGTDATLNGYASAKYYNGSTLLTPNLQVVDGTDAYEGMKLLQISANA